MFIFDFDGVLMNSMDEIVVTAYNATTREMALTLEELPKTLASLFRRNRFHVQPIGDALPLMSWGLKIYQRDPNKILSAREYASIIQNAALPLVDRTNHFFAVRDRSIKKDRDAWLSLHSPVQPTWDELVRRGGERIVILTNKNRKAVMELCRHFGLLVKSDNIFPGDEGATKTGNLEKIFHRLGKEPHQFIDDSVKNLEELDNSFNQEGTRLKLILAAWGYVGPSDESTARKMGFSVFTQRDLVKKLGAT